MAYKKKTVSQRIAKPLNSMSDAEFTKLIEEANEQYRVYRELRDVANIAKHQQEYEQERDALPKSQNASWQPEFLPAYQEGD